MPDAAQLHRQKLIAQRRCIECGHKLGRGDQGTLCSECYFAIICDPGLADPVAPDTQSRWVSQATPSPH